MSELPILAILGGALGALCTLVLAGVIILFYVHRVGKAFRGDAAASKTAEPGSSPGTDANKEKNQ